MQTSAHTFLWHDYETFGVNPRRNRPSQFAAIRTDMDLNEIEPPIELFCQPPTDTLPEPEACILTGITPQHCQERGIPEYLFAQQIHAHLSRAGTIGVGYNTIRFDDEVTRFLLWRNLIDPYGREYLNDCSRWDLIDVVRATWAMRPVGIEWPIYTEQTAPRPEDVGRPAFKLEMLSAANGLAHEAAHDAVSDVRATIALARLIKSKQPKLWDFCLKLRQKRAVLDEIGVGKPFVHLSGMYGADKGSSAIVWPFANHPTNKNELIVWDLREDPSCLMDLTTEQIKERIFTKTADLEAKYWPGIKRLPIKTIHINKSPMVVSNLKVLPEARAHQFGIDVNECLRHAEAAVSITGRMIGVWEKVFQREFGDDPVDVDQDLYGGFLTTADRRKLDTLRGLAPEDLATTAPKTAFDDARLQELVFRYRARNFAQTLSADEQTRWAQHCHLRLTEGGFGETTLAQYSQKLYEISAIKNDPQAQLILTQLGRWGQLRGG